MIEISGLSNGNDKECFGCLCSQEEDQNGQAFHNPPLVRIARMLDKSLFY